MYSIAVTQPTNIQVVEVPEPEPGPYEALIRTEYAALCNMTDRKVVEGHMPGVENYPLLLGHETVGVVLEVGAKVRSFQPGQRVVGALLLRSTHSGYASAWGGFSQFLVAGDHNAMLEDGKASPDHGWYDVYEIMTVVDPALSPEAAVLLCTWREALGSFEDFQLLPGKSLLILGGGAVGLSYTRFAHLLGMQPIVVVDPNRQKRSKALELGARQASPPDEAAVLRLAEDYGGFDFVLDAVGKESLVNLGLRCIKKGGSVCVYGVLDSPHLALDRRDAPLNFNLKFHQWPLRQSERFAQAQLTEWLKLGQINPGDFISAIFPFQEAASAYQQAQANKYIKTLLSFT